MQKTEELISQALFNQALNQTPKQTIHPAMNARRVKELYGPILEWCLAERKSSENDSKPTVIGISAPQGAGKSTLAAILVEVLEKMGERALSISIDDFYLTHAEQLELAARHPHNPYLQKRGYAGTHDIGFGTQILRQLKNLKSGETASYPFYEKGRHGGLGDRAPQSEWKNVSGPLDFIFFDGWMLGFSEQGATRITNPNLLETDGFLPAYDEWIQQLDAFLHLMPKDHRFVLNWRVEAEERMRAAGRGGMPSEEIKAYVSSFLPAYETYLPPLWKSPPLPLDHTYRVILDLDRLPA